MSVDRIDPWTGENTKVSYFSTYLSFPWITVLLKSHLQDGIEVREDKGGNNRGALSVNQEIDMFIAAVTSTMLFGDYLAPHGLVKLVDEQRKNEYISDLEEHHEKYGDYIDKSSWFKGQQIDVDLFGKVRVEVSRYFAQQFRST